MKDQRFMDFALIRRLFKSPSVRRRMAANYLGIILSGFVSDLHARGYTPGGIRFHVLTVEHFGQWLKQRRVLLRYLSTSHVTEFLQLHLPRCRCPRPAPKVQPDCRASLRRFVEFLRGQGLRLVNDNYSFPWRQLLFAGGPGVICSSHVGVWSGVCPLGGTESSAPAGADDRVARLRS